MISERRKTGDVGEELASRFLQKRGFRVIDRNYLRKWGEIDIVATKDGVYHFVEVKAVRRALHGYGSGGGYRPEENVHPAKLKRLHRAIESYLMEYEREVGDKNWQIDVVTVLLDTESKKARVEIIENVF